MKNIHRITERLLSRLFEIAKECDLRRNDLFVLTIKEELMALCREYEAAQKIGENFSIKNFVTIGSEKIRNLRLYYLQFDF